MYHKGEEKMGVSILLDGVDAYIKEEDLKECSQKASQIRMKAGYWDGEPWKNLQLGWM